MLLEIGTASTRLVTQCLSFDGVSCNLRLKQIQLPLLLGRGQVVRHMVLVHAFGGSNPSAPAMK
jgi:hypothetical protein